MAMSNTFQQESEELIRLRLKLGINRALMNCNNEQYLSQVAFNFRKSPRNIFNSVLAEMEQGGMLKKVTRKKGGVVLVRCVQGQPVNPEYAVEDAVSTASGRTR
jgi:hypothetical protein